jgi:hypothetical protein
MEGLPVTQPRKLVPFYAQPPKKLALALTNAVRNAKQHNMQKTLYVPLKGSKHYGAWLRKGCLATVLNLYVFYCMQRKRVVVQVQGRGILDFLPALPPEDIDKKQALRWGRRLLIKVEEQWRNLCAECDADEKAQADD